MLFVTLATLISGDIFKEFLKNNILIKMMLTVLVSLMKPDAHEK